MANMKWNTAWVTRLHMELIFNWNIFLAIGIWLSIWIQWVKTMDAVRCFWVRPMTTVFLQLSSLSNRVKLSGMWSTSTTSFSWGLRSRILHFMLMFFKNHMMSSQIRLLISWMQGKIQLHWRLSSSWVGRTRKWKKTTYKVEMSSVSVTLRSMASWLHLKLLWMISYPSFQISWRANSEEWTTTKK